MGHVLAKMYILLLLDGKSMQKVGGDTSCVGLLSIAVGTSVARGYGPQKALKE